MPNIMLLYPPGKLYQRGEDRCQGNAEDSSACGVRACNDLGYCAAVLERLGYAIFLRDYQTEKKTLDDVFSDIKEFTPDLIMVSVTNATIYDDIAFTNALKALAPDCVMVLKGAIFYDPAPEMLSLLDLASVDYLVGGEAEMAIGGVAEYALKGLGDIAAVDNILYRDSGTFQHTAFHVWNADLDAIPFPARSYMNNALYVRPDTNEPMATIQTSRGCAAACIYCLSPQISGKQVRYRSVENVMEEIGECYTRHGIRNFFFKADTFTLDLDWAKSLCRRIIDSPLQGKIAFTANSRTNPLDREVLALMKQAGCFMVAFGFESGSDATLKRIKKGATAAQNLQAAGWAREVGLPVFAFYMVGFPWETREDLEITRRHIFAINADYIEIHIALPYYGTELYRLCQSAGTLAEETLGNDYFTSCIAGTQSLSARELIDFRRKVFRSYYFRPSYILLKLKDCVRRPAVFVNYARYALRMAKTILKRP